MVKIRQARSSATWPLLLILLALSAATSIQARSTVRVLLAGLPSTINTASEAAYLYSLANVWSATSGIDLTFQWNTIAGVANDTASNFGWDTLTVFNNANKAATAGSADIVMFDGVYTGMMAPLLKNLSPLIPAASVAAHMPQAVAASTVAGKLYALPMTLDVALLYYRMDVLQRNGFTAPPTTWDAMGSMLSTIVSAEKARNPAIMGFLGQLRGYEGLTAFTTEWLASVANTTWLTDTLGLPTGPAGAKKQVALDAMTRLRTWITSGIIGAPAIMCDEQYSADFWGQGNAVVMRHWNWMPAYSGSVSFPWVAAPYPGSISALGGLVAGIVDSTTDAAAAAAALQFLASAQMQTARAVNSGMIPTIPALWSDPTVCNAIQICDKIKAMNFVARPSVPAGSQYLTISSLIWSNWVNMLNGQQTPAVALDSVNFGIGQTLGIDLLGPPTNIDRTNPIALFIFVVCAIGLVLTFLVTMYIGAGRAGLPLPVRVKSSIPPALQCTLLAGIAFAFMVPMVYTGIPTAVQCSLQPWLATLAVVLPVAAVAAYQQAVLITWRNPYARTVAEFALIPLRPLLVLVAAATAVAVLPVLVWTAAAPRVPITVNLGASRYIACESAASPTFELVLSALTYAICAIAVAVALVSAYSSRLAVRRFPEVKSTAFALSNAALLGVVALPLSGYTALGQSLQYLILSLGIVISVWTMLGALCIPTVMAALHQKRRGNTKGDSSASRSNNNNKNSDNPSSSPSHATRSATESKAPRASRQGSISKTSAAVAGARTGNTGGVSGSTGGIALEREGIVGYRSSRSRWWKWAARWRGARMIVFPAQGIVVFEPVDAMDSTDMGDVIGLDEIASVAVLNASGIPTPTPTDPSSDSPDSPTSPAALTGTESATPTVHEVKVVITIKNLPLEYEIMAPSRAEALQWEATLRAAAASSVSMSSVPLAGSAAQPPMLQLGGKDDRKRKLASATASVIGTATVSPPQPPPSIPVGMVMVNSASFGTDALGRRVSVVVDDGV